MKLYVAWTRGYKEEPRDPFTLEVPDDANLKWDSNQHTLVVILPSGTHIAAFYGVRYFHREDVVVYHGDQPL